MNKKEAIQQMVERDFNPIDIEWVKIIAEHKGEDIHSWPMWGTMWQVDNHIGSKLLKNSTRMAGEAVEIHLPAITDENERAEVGEAIESLINESISYGECALLEKYVDEEMVGAYNIKGTPAYIYIIDGKYLVGIHAAGWDFYEGVWDIIYDILGLSWHK